MVRFNRHCRQLKNVCVERDKLQEEISQAKQVLHNCLDIEVKKHHELQKRIDKAIDLLLGQSIGEVFKAIRILRGEQADASE